MLRQQRWLHQYYLVLAGTDGPAQPGRRRPEGSARALREQPCMRLAN